MLQYFNKCCISLSVSSRRTFYTWLNTVFNKVDEQRIKDVGPDRAAAEWLLRCGASVKWKNHEKWVSDYNILQMEFLPKNVIEEIDATESCIMHVGFPYLNDLKYVKTIKLHKCFYIEDTCINMLSAVKNSLQNLEIVSCGNVTDNGILSVAKLTNLKFLYLYDLPEVTDKEHCLHVLLKNLPECKLSFPIIPET
ncbi:ATP synthase subunit s, mitochondrial-like [Argiope bruennichi]|uniref:ATP synthase subunit s, mitochondrial-like n=1 Tax=Argiope bruennichi TaxID=94029 RepID=UPI0024955C7C|nr:ATP synthase subunit s, mitochondrial-like [Argiope bruennichi]